MTLTSAFGVAFVGEASFVSIRFELVEYRVSWIVAPRVESICIHIAGVKVAFERRVGIRMLRTPEPRTPAKAPYAASFAMKGIVPVTPSRPITSPSTTHAEFSIRRVIAKVKPMIRPPTALAAVPRDERAPLVPLSGDPNSLASHASCAKVHGLPGGTRLKLVMRNGFDLDRIPISEARVSPRQQAKWLGGCAMRDTYVQRTIR